MYAIMSGDINPSHVDPEYAHSSMLREVIAHGMWGGALISNVLGTQFPGPGTVYVDQTLHFDHPVRVGDTLTVTITCEKKFPRNHHMIFDCVCTNQDGQKVITGTAEVLAPTEKVKRRRPTCRTSSCPKRARRASSTCWKSPAACRRCRWPWPIPAMPNRSRAPCWRAIAA
jgi:acyl dehydratase